MIYIILNRLNDLEKDSLFKVGVERTRERRRKLTKESVKRDVKKYLFSTRKTDS